MTCGINPVCYVQTAIAPFWFWVQIGFWVVVALIVLAILAKVKEVFGWPGVAAVLTLGLSALAFKAGRDSVHREGDFDPPVKPKPKPKKPPTDQPPSWWESVTGRKP